MPEQEQPLGAPPDARTTGALFSRAAVARTAPFLAYIFFIVLGDLLERSGFAAADLRWLYPLRIGVVLALLAYFWRDYTELLGVIPQGRPLPGSLAGAIAVSVLTGIVVLILWINLVDGWMVVGTASGFDPRSGGQLDWLLTAIRIFGAAAVVPVMEELFWRSFLLRWIVAPDFRSIDPAQVTWKSLAITIVLFGFEHNLWLAGIVAGAAYSALYVRYRTLWMPILSHAVTNLLLGIWVVRTGSWHFW